jgi:hypothetical protein
LVNTQPEVLRDRSIGGIVAANMRRWSGVQDLPPLLRRRTRDMHWNTPLWIVAPLTLVLVSCRPTAEDGGSKSGSATAPSGSAPRSEPPTKQLAASSAPSFAQPTASAAPYLTREGIEKLQKLGSPFDVKADPKEGRRALAKDLDELSDDIERRRNNPAALGTPVSVFGPFDPFYIREFTAKHHTDFDDCCQKRIDRGAAGEAEFTAKFSIDGNGRVLTDVVGATAANPDVAQCLKEKTESLHFPKIEGYAGISFVEQPVICKSK